MKKIIIAIIAIIFTTGAIAQTDSTNRKIFPPDINKTNDGMDQNNTNLKNQENYDSKLHQVKMEKHPDGYMMVDGKMMMIKDGKMFTMENDVILNNGTTIMANGNYIKKGGIKIMLTDGQQIDLSGKMSSMKTKTPKDY